MMSRFLKSLTKSQGSIHPTAAIDDIPTRKFKPETPFTSEAYDGLTDESTYSHYAWAFLRRNRFYQLMMDRRTGEGELALWGHKPSPKSPPTFGLMDEKPYTESHDEGKPLRWWGIHSFIEQLTLSQRPGNHEKIDFKSAQVHVTFDIDALIEPGKSAISLQTNLVLAFFLKKAVDAGFHQETAKEQKRQEGFRSRMRSVLYVADLMSPQVSTEGGLIATWVSGDTPPTMQDIAKRLTDAGVETTSQKVSAHGTEAFETMYFWAFLTWLKEDDWAGRIDEIAADNLAALPPVDATSIKRKP